MEKVWWVKAERREMRDEEEGRRRNSDREDEVEVCMLGTGA